MFEQVKKLQVLLVGFEALDIEAKTKPFATVSCPRHAGDKRSLTLCGSCGHCRQVSFAPGEDVALVCDWAADDNDLEPAATQCIQQLTRMPKFCVALDTRVSTLVAHLSLDSDELVPVIDERGRLAGTLFPTVLRAALTVVQLAVGTPVSDVMSPGPRGIHCNASVRDALRLLGHDDARYLAVTGTQGRFLGIVTREDLRSHAG